MTRKHTAFRCPGFFFFRGFMQALQIGSSTPQNSALYQDQVVNGLSAADRATLDRARNPQPTPVISALSGYINKCWQAAKQAKQPIERQMLKSLRQRSGVYEADQLAAIRQMGGSEAYVLLTATKCRAATAWINDVLRPVGERLFSLEPTPEADLPPELDAAIRDEVKAVFHEVLAQARQVGQVIDLTELRDEIRKYEDGRYDEERKAIQEEAKKRAERMAQRIDDQLAEGGWHDAFWQVVDDLVTLKAGILKGPVVRRRKSQKWVPGSNGWEVNTVDTLTPEFERVSPFDLYPAPDSRNPDDGYLVERVPLTRADLVSMIGVPGYSEENIRAALRDYGPGGKHEQLPIDAERAMLEFGSTDSLWRSEKIEALEFWGSVPGQMLLDWGMGGEVDPDLEYEISALQVGHYTVKAIINPDRLGRKPYSVDSFERVPGSFWGKGVPELMADIQAVCNAVARAIINNAGLASGPQVEVNSDRCNDNEELWPWKIWQASNKQMSEQPAVRFNQPTCVVGPLLSVYQFFETMAEDQTGIPRWAHGNANVGGAGGTASGLSMLMTNASRNIKEVIAHIDNIVAGGIGRSYDYNMAYDPDDSIKGDCRAVARGTSSLLAKEQKMVRRTEFLAATANPMDAQLLGLRNRAKLLIQQARDMEMEIDEDSELEKTIQQLAQRLAAGPAQSSPQAAPQTLDAAGNPAGGTDVNAFQNQEGQDTRQVA